MRGERPKQLAFASIGRPLIGRQFGACEKAATAVVKTKEEIPIHPFEVENQGQSLPHANVGKQRPSGVEHEKLGRLRQAGLDCFTDHLAVLRRRKIVTVMPTQRLALDAEVVERALESFEQSVGFAVIVEPDLVEIEKPAIDWK